MHLCHVCVYEICIYSLSCVIIDSEADNIIRISFKESLLTVNESVGVVELRLVADKVVERELWINLSTQDGTAMSEMECCL